MNKPIETMAEKIQRLAQARGGSPAQPQTRETTPKGKTEQKAPTPPVKATVEPHSTDAANSTETQRNTGKKLGGRSGKGFMPGQSGNPAGPKPGYKHFKTAAIKIIKEEMKSSAGAKMEVVEAMIRAMVREALKGDVRAFTVVADRVDGKAPQPIIGDDNEDAVRIDLGTERIIKKAYGHRVPDDGTNDDD